MTEQSFTTEILKWAKTYKWRAFHVRNSGYGGMTAVQGDRGFPDLVLVRGEQMICAELKVEKAGTKRGEPTPEQLAWLKALEGVCCPDECSPIRTYVWRPQMWSEILAVLSAP